MNKRSMMPMEEMALTSEKNLGHRDGNMPEFYVIHAFNLLFNEGITLRIASI
jgi:hypothetical protein